VVDFWPHLFARKFRDLIHRGPWQPGALFHPIDAGQSKDIKLKVRPSGTIDAGHFPARVTVAAEDATAQTELALDVMGQPQLQVSRRDGLLSARAVAAQQSSVPIVVANTGSAPADNISLTASAPNGWKVMFEPASIDRLVPGKDAEVQSLAPSDKSLEFLELIEELRAEGGIVLLSSHTCSENRREADSYLIHRDS
jgi:hypothetical protein